MPHIFDASAAQPAIQWSWMTLSGRDARDFLHRLTTVNVNALAEGQGAPGFFLNAQGKVRAYFNLWRFAPDSFAFEFDAGATGHWKQELLTTIDQATFAEKQELADVTALAARWIFAETDQLSATLSALGVADLKSGETRAIDEEIRVCHHGNVDFGRAWITVWGRPARLNQWAERALPDATVVSPRQMDAWRIGALRPRVDAEITSNTIPLEAGLTDALAQGKGCYPGQEVIERIVSLGSPARRLVLIEGQGPGAAPGELLTNLAEPSVEIGNVTSVSTLEGTLGFIALGYVRKIHAKEGLAVRFGGSGASGSITRVAPYV